MAQISINVDTESKEVSVSVDGKVVEAVHDVCIYTENSGYFGVDIKTMEQMNNLTKIMHLVAKNQKNKPDGEKHSKCAYRDLEKIEEFDDNTLATQDEMSELVASSFGWRFNES